MTTRPSLIAANNQNWLLSYTDLFLLVLSFFVLRFSVLKYDLKPLLKLQEDTPSVTEKDRRLYFKVDPTNTNSDKIFIYTPINSDWFSDQEMSALGERKLNYIAKKIGDSKGSAVLKISKPDLLNLETTDSNLLLLISKLQALGLVTLRIERSLNAQLACGNGLKSSSDFACLDLEF